MGRLCRGVSVTDVPPSPRPRVGRWRGAKACWESLERELRGGTDTESERTYEKDVGFGPMVGQE